MRARDLAVVWSAAFAAGMAVLTLERALLAVLFRPDTAAESLWWAFILGARFDAASVAYVLIPAFLVSLAAARSARARDVEHGSIGLALATLIVLAIVEVHFFREFHRRLDFVLLEYLDDPGTALGMAVAHVGIGWVALQVAVSALLLVVLMRVLWRDTEPGHFRQSSECGLRGVDALAPNSAESVLAPYRIPAARAVVLVLLVVAARGGLGRPLRPQDATAGQEYFSRQLALSGPFTLARHAYEALRDRDELAAYGVTPDADLIARSQARVATPDEQFLAGAGPMLRSGTAHSSPWKNVVMIVLESFAARHVGALGAAESWTPEFDRLAGRGVLFTRFLANGPSTNRGLPALLVGLPSLPRRLALTKSMEGQQPLLSLARVLGAAGRSTTFLTAGQSSWENLGGWCAAQGFANIVDADAFADADALSVWGVSDDRLLTRVLDECDRVVASGPFLTVALTSSNHPPFAVPDEFDAATDNTRERAFRYADAALGRFLDRALARPWARDTLFVLVGDHGLHERARIDLDPERYHVPLLLIDGGASPRAPLTPRIEARLASQVDVLPIVLRLLGEPGPHAAWGRDALAPDAPPGFVILGPHGGVRTIASVSGDGLYVVTELTSGYSSRAFRWDPVRDAIRAVDVTDVAEAAAMRARETLFLLQRTLDEGAAGGAVAR